MALAQFCVGIHSDAQDIGDGAIVIRAIDRGSKVPVYVHAEGGKVEAMAERGDYVAGITVMSLVNHRYTFETRNGRVHIVYFANRKQTGIQRTAWMDPKDLDTFTYECSCGAREFYGVKAEQCSPFSRAGFVKRKWNDCFLKARDQKLAVMETPQ
jgi:hypothetical protein